MQPKVSAVFINIVLAVWLSCFVAIQIIHFFDGWSQGTQTQRNDSLMVKKCTSDADIRLLFAEKCNAAMVNQGRWAFFYGFDNVAAKLTPCVFFDCEKVFGTFGFYAMCGLTAIAVLYIMYWCVASRAPQPQVVYHQQPVYGMDQNGQAHDLAQILSHIMPDTLRQRQGNVPGYPRIKEIP